MKNNRDRYRHILDQQEKRKDFLEKMSVRPCVKVMYTKTQERIKMIECGFFCLYTGNRNCLNFDPNARRFTKLEPNEMFNNFAISREPFDEIDSNFFYFKGMDKEITPNPIGPERTKISEVRAEWKFFEPYLGVQVRNCEILKKIALILPKLHPNEVLAEVVFWDTKLYNK